MKTLDVLLLEALDKPYKIYDLGTSSFQFPDENGEDLGKWRDGIDGKFETDDGNKYDLLAVYMGRTKEEIDARKKKKRFTIPSSFGGIWEIHFSLIGGNEEDYDDYKGGIEGTGDAFRVFATVKKFAEKVIDKKRPKEIHIQSKASVINRVKLYGTLVKKFAPKLGYKLKKIGKVRGNINYILVRK